MKTIGYVLADFPVFSETFVGEEMRAMARLGYTVQPIVMHLCDGPAQAADVTLAQKARTVSSASTSEALRTLLRPGLTAASAIEFLFKQKLLRRRSLMWNGMKIAAIARAFGCDHLHAHFSGGAAAHAIVAARWIGVPVTFVCHGGHDVYTEPADLPAKLDAADAVVAVCGDVQSDLRRLAAHAQIKIIHCGIDPDAFRPRHDGEPLRRLLFIGRLVEQKGIDDLLAALVIERSASVDLVGDGPLAAELKELADALGVASRVNFLGLRSREWLVEHGPDYFGLVAPFKQARDGSRDTGPVVIKEAMAMGLPVVGTRFMGIKEIVSPETGFFADPGDPMSLAEAIGRLFALSPEERVAMGRRARERVVERFSLDVSSQALSKIVEAA